MSQRKPSSMSTEEFREWRQRHGLTQAEAADRLGVSKRSIFGWENSGPIPKSIELACKQISLELEEPDYTQLVREQYPRLGGAYLVIPLSIERSNSYSEVLRTHFTSEVQEWLIDHGPSVIMELKTVITAAERKIQVPVIFFESDADAVYFKLRWY